jgi:GPH family glycoside/pentoside/hexuronide:cation symporter
MRLATKVGYAIGDFGLSIAYFAVGFFFLYYLTDVVGLAASLAGTVVLIGKLWDGVNDPLIGVLSDRTRSRHGRKRVYLLYGAAPFALSFALLWRLPLHASETITFLLACAALLLFATTYSLVAVPYMALVPVMTRDYDERTELVGYRAMLSAAGTIAGGAIALLVSGGAGASVSLRTLSLGFALACGVAMFVAAASVRGVETGGGADIARIRLGRYLALARDRDVATLLWFKLLGAVATGSLTAALPFFAVHVLGDAGVASYSLAIYTVAAASLVPVVTRLSRRFDKRYLLAGTNLAAACLLALIAFLMRTDTLVPFLLGSGLLGAALSAYLVIPPSFVPDLVEWYQYRRGERHESVFFGLWMTVHQIGLGIAGFVLGILLQLFGYDGAATGQSASGILGVRLAFGVLPAAFLVIASLVLLRYRITRERFETARDALAPGGGAA